MFPVLSMYPQRCRLVAIAFEIMFLAVVPAVASPAPSPLVSTPELQIEDVRTVLAQIGYEATRPVGALDGPVPMVEARAVKGPEIVRVLVFADSAAAAIAHRQADAVTDGGLTWSDDVGPQLLSGYGASAWRRNVALIQTSPETFGRLMPPESDCVDGTSTPTVVPFREYRVDPAVIQAVESFR